ncbi:Non-specific serine/threonine protein kinase [Bertholletia excelsa]
MVRTKLEKWVSLALVVFLGTVVNKSLPSFTPTDNYFLVCGSLTSVTFLGLTYFPDSVQSSVTLKTQSNSIVYTSNSSVPSPVYQSARVFPSTASYKFDIKKEGRHWVRLYFFPLPDSSHNFESASITVVTENFVLLNNFTFKNYNGSYLFKEYAIYVTSGHLILTFVPSINSFTFVNAIEVVSTPEELIPDQAQALHLFRPLNERLSEHAFETVHRLNMGGPRITAQNDTLGRTWENDSEYLHDNGYAEDVTVNPGNIKYRGDVTPEVAPNWVYATAKTIGDSSVPFVNFNATWVLPVDSSCTYFIRVHFCDIISKSTHNLVFNLYINSDIALRNLDLLALTGDLGVPYYKDFISSVPADLNTLAVSVGPDADADIPNAILNGLEILKISNEDKSLDGNQPLESLLPISPRNANKIGIVGSILGALAAMVLVSLCCGLVFFRLKTNQQEQKWYLGLLYSQKSKTTNCISLSSSNLGRFFTFREIIDATNKFDESLLLGVGGFGKVYKGTLEDGLKVAVKRGSPRSEQGLVEFQNEIEMLSKLRHRHLVSLIGYSNEKSEMILVYEYMANGPLRSHLYGTDLPPLSWKQRLEICIGAARGLHYLHNGATQKIIHRDVKTANILLDENFVAKVADFGLSKIGPVLDQTHVSTAVKGSFGYLDPEYFRRQQLSEKSDVYSFGVVLMEVLCARPALNPILPKEQVNIVEWAISWQKKGMLDQIMDPNLVGKVNPSSLKKFGETAEKCLAEYGVDRPSIGDVLWNLEYAFQLEETSAALMEPEDQSTKHITCISLSQIGPSEKTTVSRVDGVNSGTDEDEAEDTATSAVFSP